MAILTSQQLSRCLAAMSKYQHSLSSRFTIFLLLLKLIPIMMTLFFGWTEAQDVLVFLDSQLKLDQLSCLLDLAVFQTILTLTHGIKKLTYFSLNHPLELVFQSTKINPMFIIKAGQHPIVLLLWSLGIKNSLNFALIISGLPVNLTAECIFPTSQVP